MKPLLNEEEIQMHAYVNMHVCVHVLCTIGPVGVATPHKVIQVFPDNFVNNKIKENIENISPSLVFDQNCLSVRKKENPAPASFSLVLWQAAFLSL